MQALCKPLKCLSFLSGRKAAEPEYQQVDSQTPACVDVGAETGDEDDFFGDDWEKDKDKNSASKPSKEAEVKAEMKSQSVERNPSRETTTKRGTSPKPESGGGTSPASAAAAPQPKSQAKKDDFFSELGMVDEYKAPRILNQDGGKKQETRAAQPLGRSVSDMLEEGDEVSPGGWGDDDDLDL